MLTVRSDGPNSSRIPNMVLSILLLIGLLLLNALLTMSELAIMTSRQSRLQKAASNGDAAAAAAISLAREPTRFLSTVQVGITLIGIFAGAFGENSLSAPLEKLFARVEAISPYADTLALLVVVLAITYVSLVFGELIPKRIALSYPEAAAMLIARPLNFVSKIAAWPVRLLTASTEGVLKILRVKPRSDDVSEEDVRALVARAATTGVFDPLEHEIFERAFRLGDLRVKSLMVPRADIVWIDETMGIDDVRVLLGTSPHSHFPVCRATLDTLVGVVHIKDLIAYGLLAGSDFKPSVVASKPHFVPEATPALKLLKQMQESRNHIAFVVDEYGGTEGLITLNDIVKVLVGDLSRAGEEQAPGAVGRPDGSYLVDGRMPLHEVVVTLRISEEREKDLPDVATAAGLVVALLGRVPSRADTCDWCGWRFEVVDMDGKRVDQILASPIPPEPATE